MPARVLCRAELGLSAPRVSVEVDVGAGLPNFYIVGLPAKVVRESKERVRAALQNSGFEFPAGRITVSLAPADLPKQGGRFDLPIALGILIASRQLRGTPSGLEAEFYGELGLSGELRPVKGLLLAAAAATADGQALIVPQANVRELAVCASAVRGAGHLAEVCAHVSGRAPLPAPVHPPTPVPVNAAHAFPDLADVRGQSHAKQALLVAAAGGHSLLLIGAPGSGKSMLAQRLPGLLPPTTPAEALELAAIESVSQGGFRAEHFGRRPFRAPHHTASAVALVGGGAQAQPGEVSLAHHGVLFLDELAEFGRAVLDSLREPLETGSVCIARALRHVRYPARFQLVAAMNPCPCGLSGESCGECHCSPAVIQAYRSRVSGPLLDRIDMHVSVLRPAPAAFEEAPRPEECSAALAARSLRARLLQVQRQGVCNALLPDAMLSRWCEPEAQGQSLLNQAMRAHGLSGRARQRILRLARTAADLEAEPQIRARHVTTALGLRCLDGAAG